MHGVTPEFANTLMYLTIPLLIGGFGYMGLLLFNERIPPNSVFGFRTKRTRADVGFWYAANKAAGGYLLAADVISAVLFGALVMSDMANPQAVTLALMIPLGVAVALSLVWHERH